MKTTKELARELGLIRKRTLSSSSASRRALNSGSSAQIFKYLIVIDFESTCWKDAKFRTQEIIEFPAVLLNTLSGEVESEFHHYVQPQEQPTLSAFCTELTGITQSQVDDGIPINLCLRKFGHWLDRLYREKGVVCQGTRTDTNTPVNTTCVTWSDWDLGVCLQYECKRKQLLKPPQLTSWIDLRATYRKFYDRKPNGLNGALQDLGIEFQGREHSGVDDARNTAKLAFRMIKDGCQMKVTKTLKTHERSVSCNPTMLQYVSKATRTTPPRKAKEKSNSATISSKSPKESLKSSASTNKQPKVSPSKIPVTTPISNKSPKEALKSTAITNKQPKDSPSKIPIRRKTPEKSIIKKQDSEQSSSICQCYNVNSVCGSDNNLKIVRSADNKKRKQFTPVKDMSKNGTNSPSRKNSRKFSPKKLMSADKFIDLNDSDNMQVNITEKVQSSSICQCYDLKSVNNKKRKQFTPVKDMSKNSTNSPRRKISRKFCPKKFTSADIFVDPDEPSDVEVSSTSTVKPVDIMKGLLAQDTNIQVDKSDPSNSNFKKDSVKGDADCFKLPNPVNKPGAQSMFKTPQSFIKPNALNGSSYSKSRSFTTSTPVGGTNSKSGFNQSKIISPFSNQSGKLTGLSDCVTPSSFSSGKTGFKTPCQTPSFDGSKYQSGFSINSSNMKVTSPLCKCGRRSKRRMVQSPGQNMGRFFFSCAVRKSVGSKEGCDFFKWETTGMTQNNSVISKQFTPVGRGTLQQMSGATQKKSLGVRSMPPQKVYMR